MITASCKKDNKQATAPGNKKYNVNFAVSDFTQQHTSFLSLNSLQTNATTNYVEVNSDTISKKYRVLYYLREGQDSGGSITTQTSAVQYQGDSDFGTFTQQLLPGTYTYLIVGGENDSPGSTNKKGRYLEVANGGYDLQYELVLLGGGRITSTDFNDFFLKQVTFTITNTDINQSVSLDRMVGKLDVVIQDAIPSNITSIDLRIAPTANVFDVNSGPLVNSLANDEFFISAALHGTTNFDMSTLILNTSRPFAVTIAAYNGTTLIASKNITGITCSANKVTLLKGNLFGGTGTGGSINVKGDTTWNVTPITYHF